MTSTLVMYYSSTYHFNFDWVPQYIGTFFRAFEVTLELLGISAVFSMVVGLIAGQLLTSRHKWVSLPVRGYVDLFRLTPILLQITIIYFLLPEALHVDINAILSGAIALSLNYGAFNAEIFRAGILSIDPGQWEASRALGMKWHQCLRRIIYPQVIRRMLPPLGSMLIGLTKDTSLVSIIGVQELFLTAQSVGAETFRQLEAFIVVAAFYLMVTLPLSILASYATKRVSGAV